jgi:hypothetical protein
MQKLGSSNNTVNAFRAYHQGLDITRICVKGTESILSMFYSFLHLNGLGLLQTFGEERPSSPHITV